jgi:hypothetical protein
VDEDRSRDDELMADLARLLGTIAPGPDERAAVLDLTRVVAHGVQRRFGPVAAYALGLAVPAGADPEARTAALRAAIARLEGPPAPDGSTG